MSIHEQLRADTHILGQFDQSRVLLHRNAIVPWLILVPDCVETELFALPQSEREQLLVEAARAAAFIRTYFGSPKINFAALGNVVPQLHLHVIGREPGDTCWPAPVWGNLVEEKSYTDAEVVAIIEIMSADFDLRHNDIDSRPVP